MCKRLNLGFVTLLITLVFGFWVNGAYASQQDVDTIYNTIRNSNPEISVSEELITFTNEGMTLVGTLVLPNSPKKCPIVISLTGFLGDRNSVVVPGTNEGLLKRNARKLAEIGIATLLIDFRGSGESDGDYSMTTFSTQISDTLAAVDYVYNNLRHKVDHTKIGLLGFSQGGFVGSIVAAKDKRVKSLVLWSPGANMPVAFVGLLTFEGVQQGLALNDGGSITLPVYYGPGGPLFAIATLGKGFFKEMFEIDPLAEMGKCKTPLMVIVASQDTLVWPQPAMGQLFLKYHDGDEKLVLINGADHAFNYWDGPEPEKLDDAIYWGAAWFISTFNIK